MRHCLRVFYLSREGKVYWDGLFLRVRRRAVKFERPLLSEAVLMPFCGLRKGSQGALHQAGMNNVQPCSKRRITGIEKARNPKGGGYAGRRAEPTVWAVELM